MCNSIAAGVTIHVLPEDTAAATELTLACDRLDLPCIDIFQRDTPLLPASGTLLSVQPDFRVVGSAVVDVMRHYGLNRTAAVLDGPTGNVNQPSFFSMASINFLPLKSFCDGHGVLKSFQINHSSLRHYFLHGTIISSTGIAQLEPVIGLGRKHNISVAVFYKHDEPNYRPLLRHLRSEGFRTFLVAIAHDYIAEFVQNVRHTDLLVFRSNHPINQSHFALCFVLIQSTQSH